MTNDKNVFVTFDSLKKCPPPSKKRATIPLILMPDYLSIATALT